MSYFGVCEVCHHDVRSDAENPRHRTPAFPVVGFEVPRAQGGANHIRNRQRVPNRVRHEACLEAEPVEQGRLM